MPPIPRSHISISQGHVPKPNPGGINVVIDVIRAFTTCHVAYLSGISGIILVGQESEAFELRQSIPDAFIAGENAGLPIEGFDYCNSPTELDKAPIKNRMLILKTSNGVKCTLNAMDAERVFVSGFCNAEALCKFLRSATKIGQHIQLIASHPTGEDDLICADVIVKGLVENLSENDLTTASNQIRASGLASKMSDPLNTDYNSEDIEYCCDTPRKQLVLEAKYRDGRVYVEEVNRFEK